MVKSPAIAKLTTIKNIYYNVYLNNSANNKILLFIFLITDYI